MKNIQCILCKYRNDKDKCFDATYNHGYKCPSLSNIYYGKLIKLPVIKQIHKIHSKINMYLDDKRYEKNYIDEYETHNVKFIWGIKASDELTCEYANLFTMNDIDLLYLKDKEKYVLSIELVYWFDTEEDVINYLKSCLQAFTEFMIENNYNMDKKPSWQDVFSDGCSISNEYDSIEDCYATFKLLVNGYCSLQEGQHEEKKN